MRAALDAQTVTLPAEQTRAEIIADPLADLDRVHALRDELAATIEEVFLLHRLGAVLVTLCGFGPKPEHEPSPARRSVFMPYGVGSLLVSDRRAPVESHQGSGAYRQDVPDGMGIPDFFYPWA